MTQRFIGGTDITNVGGPAVHRRLAAILAADVVGYSELMGEDEEETLARIKALRRDLIEPKATEHRGRIFKTAGDGFLLEFASPVEAVRYAAEVQEALGSKDSAAPYRPLRLRIGINLGDIIIEDDGDVYGDGVNVAARLEQIAEPGGITLSGKVFEEVRDKLAYSFEYRGEQQVKNIARPVKIYVLHQGPRSALANPRLSHPALPDKPSIAVLPFTNMSGDPEQEYFADGVVEDIITALSHFPRLFVIARNSSFTYKNRAVDVRHVGKELGVRYVLEGSVRRSGGRLRLTGQLIDTHEGTHLWAERFDGSIEDVFALQDEMTMQIVGAIVPRLQSAEIERSKRNRPDSLDAYDLYLRALSAMHEMTREASDEALALVDHALKIDPDYAVAAGLGAWAYTVRAAQYWPVDREAEQQRGLALGRMAVLKGQNDADALGAGGYALAFLGAELHEGLRAIERAIGLNPNSAIALAHAGWVRSYLGQPREAIEALQRSIRLSPRDPLLFRAHAALAFSHLLLEEFDEAIAWGTRAIEANPNYTVAYRPLASALAHAGRYEEARTAISRLAALVPGLSLRRLPETTTFKHSGRLELILDGLRAAGVPE
ncbi:MAG TPA: adenylate/guanylate cyclase domain-containing protein [Aestuariivirgaceae bacterium]|nr:adenylate/guanylate cyclase domain-containing protein [Aestuariivirgaceae bacterium]